MSGPRNAPQLSTVMRVRRRVSFARLLLRRRLLKFCICLLKVCICEWIETQNALDHTPIHNLHLKASASRPGDGGGAVQYLHVRQPDCHYS
mmetsp:Transcript_4063/g.16364  ORF Transcript_4063/g.16364 Transcript_4063/m.16364 type:complete len:91 (-) Transcript_4063:300-572(-)